MHGGPQDGLHLSVPDDCRELRFPVVLDPGFILQYRGMSTDDVIESVQMKVSIYRRGLLDRFYYEGEQ